MDAKKKAVFAIAIVAIAHWAFAQEGSTPGSVKDLAGNHGIQDVTIKVKDAIPAVMAGTLTTDEIGKNPLNLLSRENCTRRQNQNLM
jgi:hypothetical protein